MNRKKNDSLHHENIRLLILTMSGPAITAMLVMSLYNFVDAIYMGMLGSDALGAATIGYPFMMFLTALGLMFGQGGASYQSRVLGEGRMEEAEVTAAVVIGSGVMAGLLTTAAVFPLSGPVSLLFGASEGLKELSSQYIGILSAGAVFSVANMCTNNLLRAEGSAMQSFAGMAAGAVLNTGLDPLFMFVFGWGVKGAAAATVISQGMGLLLLLSFYFRKKTTVALHWKNFRPNLKNYREIFKNGIPSFLQQLLTTVAASVMNNAAAQFGDSVVAAVGALNRIYMLGISVLLGFGQGLQPVLGFNYGAKRFDRIGQALRFSLLIATGFCILLSAVSFLFPQAIASAFSDEAGVVGPISAGIVSMGFVWPFMGLFFVAQVLFGAFGKSVQATALAVSRQGLFLIVCVEILTDRYHTAGLVSSFAVSGFLSFLLALALFVPSYLDIVRKSDRMTN